MIDWTNLDFSDSVKDYDFTKIIAKKFSKIVESKDFIDMDVDRIMQYLLEKVEIVKFSDHLKRYIYHKAEIEAPYKEVTEEMYLEILNDNFMMNDAPYSFKKTSKRRSTVFKDWLNTCGVRRSTIFLLGFGLRMSAEDVSMFLTKVNKESDFNFGNIEETVYWYCFKKSLPYSSARQMKEMIDEIPEDTETVSESKFLTMQGDPGMLLMDEENLIRYLTYLKLHKVQSKLEEKGYEIFGELYRKSREMIAREWSSTYENTVKDIVYTAEDITPTDVESTICSGIPVDKSGNLQKMSGSLLNSQFEKKRLSRQRITAILKRKQMPDRFDIITLLFYLYSGKCPGWPTERYIQFLDEANRTLALCGMDGIYPVNPYESFVLMCLLADDPLDVFAEVWDQSYRGGENRVL